MTVGLLSCAKGLRFCVFKPQGLNHLSDVLYGNELDFILIFCASFHVLRRDNYPFKARFYALVHTLVRIGNGANFARQAHFAKESGIFVDGHVVRRRGKRRADGKIDRRLVEANTAHSVDIHVRIIERDTAAFF